MFTFRSNTIGLSDPFRLFPQYAPQKKNIQGCSNQTRKPLLIQLESLGPDPLLIPDQTHPKPSNFGTPDPFGRSTSARATEPMPRLAGGARGFRHKKRKEVHFCEADCILGVSEIDVKYI